MKYHLTGYGVSALLHAAVLLAALPVILWQDKLGNVAEPQPVQLSLAQFVPAPPPEPPTPQPVAAPVPPKPEPKPVEKPKPKPEKKPVEKPKPEKRTAQKTRVEQKPPEKPQPVPRVEPQPVRQQLAPKPQPRPAPVARPVTPAPQAAAPAPVADNKAAEAAYRRKLQNLIASRKQYPRMAEKAEVEGSVVVAFTVMPNGTISGVRVSKSSGNDWLDKAAVQAVNAASGALPFPAEIRKQQWSFSLTVNFKLDW